MKKANKTIKFRQSLFWDTDPKKIDKKKNARYIIERILDFGYECEIKWMLDFYDKRLIKGVVLKSRCIRLSTRKVWISKFGIKEKKLNRPMTKYEKDMLKMRKCFG